MNITNQSSKSYPISSNSRSKLSAFRYTTTDEPEPIREKPSSKTQENKVHNNKENQSSWLNGVMGPRSSDAPKQESAAETAQPKPMKEGPQTPANRIPLADLIGNAEDALLRDPGPQITPEDYVIWQHVPPSSNPDTGSQTPAITGRKRRHSSSPTSSPLAGSSKSARKESFDLQSVQAALRTPQNDLAADLWNNYVGKVTDNGRRDLPQPRFANLLSSSPHTPVSARTGQDFSGLRRSNSCNAEWPSSKAKRRKVDGEKLRSGRGIFARSRSNFVESGRVDSSKINQLVETIEKSLRRTQPRASGQSSVDGSKNTLRARSNSPVENRVPNHPQSKDVEVDSNQFGPDSGGAAMETSSDYGDDDLDQGFLELVEASEDPFVDTTRPHSLTKRENIGPSANSSLGGADSYSDAPRPELKEIESKRNDASEADEFDEFDDFSDNIEDLLAACDATPSNRLRRSVPRENLVPGKPAPEVDADMLPSEAGQAFQELESPHDESSNEFDDGDLDMDAIEQSMLQAGADGSSHKIKGRQAIKRYLIVDIAEGTYTTEKGRMQPEQVLLVQDERNKLKKVIILRDSWFDTPCSKDLYIHLIGDFDATGQCVVNDSRNMVILHPDHLVSATVVADSIGCQRRAVLQDRIKNSGDIGKPQVFGNIFHELFQEALKLNRWDMTTLRSLTETVVLRHIEELYLIHMSISEGVEYMMSKIPALKSWAELFVRSKPSDASLIEDRNSSKMRLSINKLLEVEEHIWSPMYGLKGNIDATVQVACHDGESDKNLVVPLELKTGNRDTNHSHRAQTALYTLLLSDRYDLDVTFGLLYYVETSKIFRIRGIRHELLQMIHARNRLAGYMRDRTHLPPMIKRPGMCNRCYAKTPCFIYHKLADGGDGETSGLGDDFANAMDHLNPQHQQFFQKWDDLLTKEEQSMMRFKRELWTLLSSEREALGRCFGNIVIEPGSAYEDKNGLKINRYRYTFIKKQATPSFSFTESQLVVGEPIVISDEEGHFALANGYIVQVSPKRITVAVDRRLHNARTKAEGFDPQNNQTFRGIMETSDSCASSKIPLEPEEQTLYRLDKDEFSNGMATVRNNLVSMMERDLFQAKNLRRLIIEGEAPEFKPASNIPKISEPGGSTLNVDQKRAIDKVMSARDYALVLGMPGTGKTTTISHIIRALVSQGKSVLLTSYTHTAVDNILLKIRDDNVKILRIGAAAKVHPEIQEFADLAATPKETMEELKAAYEDSQVVATTCLGVNHNIFNQRVFDYCIVDEASQITLPVCLGPIRMARTFILVGDHYQLPPLVQNKEAQEGGLDVSLFKLLSDSHPESVVNLEHQYRMCEEIMLLSNSLIYSGKLKCGTSEVAERSLALPNLSNLRQYHVDKFFEIPTQRELCLGSGHRCWLRDLVEPSAKTRLVNTDTLGSPALDVANGSRIVNPTEATLCSQLVEAFVSCGIPARSIGVITFYRSQLSLLRQNLRHHLPELEMHTADKFQGRDKEVVILSCVRSNSENNVGDLLRDWRRVNVAFTRARTKLLVIGSKRTLRDGNDLLAKYVKLVEGRGWVYDLPKCAVENHIFESDSLQEIQSHSPPKSDRSPKKSSSTPRNAANRNPLSPLQGHQASQGHKKPAKRGAKLMSGSKVLGNRPVLQDVVNDLVG